MSDEEEDQAGVDDEDAEFFAGEFKPSSMSGDQVDEEDQAEEVASGVDGDFKVATGGTPIEEEALKILFLSLVKADFYLGECANKNQAHGKRQGDNGEAKGAKE